jgi:hypothetical protein
VHEQPADQAVSTPAPVTQWLAEQAAGELGHELVAAGLASNTAIGYSMLKAHQLLDVRLSRSGEIDAGAMGARGPRAPYRQRFSANRRSNA